MPSLNKGKEIEIELTKTETSLYLRVEDNGVGISEAISPKEESTFGFNLIQSLAKKLSASIQLASDNGT